MDKSASSTETFHFYIFKYEAWNSPQASKKWCSQTKNITICLTKHFCTSDKTAL